MIRQMGANLKGKYRFETSTPAFGGGLKQSQQ
jgi:hypothetical protein